MKSKPYLLSGVCLFFVLTLRVSAQTQYPFQDPKLPIEERVNNVVSLMTREEKVAFLSSRPGVPRLGIRNMGHCEGLHGMAQGGPSNWGRRNPHPMTIFPQAYGMGETWDIELMRQAGAVEGYEVRYMVQSEKYRRGGLIVRAPNADLGRDPRWGRTEECHGEDPFFNGTMAAAFIKGLQGDHPTCWLTASLLKHFLANSNEDDRVTTSSDFGDRLFREYYSVPFRMGFEEGGTRCFMAAYNLYNKIPCTVHPVINEVAVKEWGVDGIICTDGGAFANLIRPQHYYPDLTRAAAGAVKAGINQFLDRNFSYGVSAALNENRLTEADIEKVIKGTLRVFIRLGLLDPPANVPYAKIGEPDEPEPWTTDKHKALARLVTQKSIVLLKNSENLLPLDKTKLKSIAVIGPLADKVLLDWYSGTPPYTVTPLDGIKAKVGPNVTVNCATNNDNGEAVKACRTALDINPENADAWCSLGAAYHSQEKFDEAVEAFRRALSINPNNAKAWYNLGNAYYAQRKLDEAVQAYRKALSINPNYAEAWSNLGVAYHSQGKFDEAVKACTQALSMNPNLAEAWNNLAVAYYGRGGYASAWECVRKCRQAGRDVGPDFLRAQDKRREELEKGVREVEKEERR